MNQNDKIRDIEDIDDIIYIKIPDCNIDLDLYHIVINTMIYDSCDSAYSDSSYIIDEKCSKKYPPKFCDEMILNEENYPIYRRREVIEEE